MAEEACFPALRRYVDSLLKEAFRCGPNTTRVLLLSVMQRVVLHSLGMQSAEDCGRWL